MMKFFRKHNKKLLAVFASGLLIVWLAGDALTYFVQPDVADTVVATYVGGNITREQLNRVSQETDWLVRLGLLWQAPFQSAKGPLPPEGLDVPSWFLLREEARRMGIRSDQTIVESTLLRGQLRPAMVTRMAEVARVKPGLIYDALAGFEEVTRYGNKMRQAVAVNAAEVRRYAQGALDRVDISSVVLRAEMFEDPEATFSEAEIQRRFEEYKDRPRVAHSLESGYMLPPRVKVQYAKINPQQLELALSTSDQAILAKDEADLTLEEQKLLYRANRYWKAHKQDEGFRRPPEAQGKDEAATQPADATTSGMAEPATTEPADATTAGVAEPAATQPGLPNEATTQPTTAPADAQAAESAFYASWTSEPQVREIALQMLRREEGAEQAAKLAAWLKDQTALPWDAAEIGTNGYKIPVEAVKDVEHYAELVDKAPGGMTAPEAVSVETSAWIQAASVFEVPDLGVSYFADPTTGQPIQFADLVFNVEGLATIPQRDEEDAADRGTYLALFQTCPYVMRDFQGNLYLWRPVEVDQQRPARNLDEVRDEVVEDLRRVEAFKKAQAEAKRVYEAAMTEGLQTAWDAESLLQQAVEQHAASPDAFARRAGLQPSVSVRRRSVTGEDVEQVPFIGKVTPDFVETCFAMGSEEASDRRVRLLPLAESATVVVAEWIKDVPLDQQIFNIQAQNVASRLELRRTEEYFETWLAPKQIKARNRFEFIESQ